MLSKIIAVMNQAIAVAIKLSLYQSYNRCCNQIVTVAIK